MKKKKKMDDKFQELLKARTDILIGFAYLHFPDKADERIKELIEADIFIYRIKYRCERAGLRLNEYFSSLNGLIVTQMGFEKNEDKLLERRYLNILDSFMELPEPDFYFLVPLITENIYRTLTAWKLLGKASDKINEIQTNDPPRNSYK